MVILVVASIIGFSVFSRLMTQKKSVIQERESSEALEVADMILTNFLLSTPEDWQKRMVENFVYQERYSSTGIGSEENQPEPETEETGLEVTMQSESGATVEETGFLIPMQSGPIEDGSSDAITKLTSNLGHPLYPQDFNICPLSIRDNIYTVQLSRTNEDTEFALRPGETFVFPIKGKSLGDACNINITFSNQSEMGGFVINRIYQDTDGIKEYDYGDTANYCFSKNGSTCVNPNFTSLPVDGWQYHDKKNKLTVPIPSTAPFLERIQLTAIDQELLFKFSMTSTCTEKIQLWQLRASATCNGTYRAKEVIVPDVGWNYSIFNYVLFNGRGNISSGQ